MATDELLRKRVRNAYLEFEGSDQAFLRSIKGTDLNTSPGTFGRWKREGGWGKEKAGEAIAAPVIEAAAKRVAVEVLDQVRSSASDTPDLAELVREAIADLSAEIPSVSSKTKGEAVTAMLRAIEVYRKLRPLTMGELADLALTTPGFSSQEFVKELRSRIDRAG